MWGYRSFYLDRCKQMLAESGLVPSSLQEAVCQAAADRISEFAERAQVEDFHRWRSREGLAASPRSSAAINRYKKSFPSTSAYVDHLHGRFPQLRERSDAIVASIIAFAEEILNHWYSDRTALADNGLIPPEAGIAAWEFLFDESHHGGRGAVSICWQAPKGRGELVYKPRRADGELTLGALFDLVAEPGEQFVPTVLACGDHSWHQHIPRCQVHNAERYLRRCGKVLAVCLLLGTTDLHADNVRPGPNDCPVIVDGETAVQLRPSTGSRIGTWELFSTGLLPTTLGAALLMAYGGLSGGQGLGPSLQQNFVTFKLSDPGTDAVSVRRALDVLRVPPLGPESHAVDSASRRRWIIEGFRAATESLIATQKLGATVADSIRGKSFRQVVRGTNVYYALLTASSDPSYLSGEAPSPFRLLTEAARSRDSLASAVADSEVRQLSQGDVPYFHLDVAPDGTCSVVDDCGLRISPATVGYPDGLELGARMKWLASLTSEQLYSALALNDCTLGLSVRPAPIDDLKQYLLDTRADEDAQWLWVDSTSPGQLRLAPGGVSLLGSLGTAYAVGQADKAVAATQSRVDSAKLRWHSWGPAASSCVIEGFGAQGLAQWRVDLSDLVREPHSGDYLTGVLGFIAHVPPAWRSPELRELVSHAEVEDNDGLAHGRAGLLPAAVAAGHETAPELAAQLADRLSPAETFDGLAWCRGTTGIVAALAASGHLSRRQADDYVESVRRLCDVPATDGSALDLSFCHGVAGIIGVLDRLASCGHHGAETEAASLRRHVSRKLSEGDGYYLAHPQVTQDPGFLNGYGSLLWLRTPARPHPLLPPLQEGVSHALG